MCSLSHGPKDGLTYGVRANDAIEMQTKPLASLVFHTAVRVDWSISLGSTWRVSVVVRIHYAYRKEDVNAFSMHPTPSDFIHITMSQFVCLCSRGQQACITW